MYFDEKQTDKYKEINSIPIFTKDESHYYFNISLHV